MNRSTTRLSIGLPVYNGENFLAEAIDSILKQSYQDFELVISDNASTDRTSEICQGYAAHDKRIRYHRNPTNIGSGPNFDKAFELSSGSEYFKWAAHDDVLMPTFLQQCVSTLDGDPDAVLCQSLVALIDAKGNVTDIHDPKLKGTRSTRAPDRFASIVLQPHMSTDFFGVIRKAALDGAPLMRDYVNGDHVLLAVLALRGPFILIPEPLFQNRSHPQRDSEGGLNERAATWDKRKVGRTKYPLLRQYAGYVHAIRREDLTSGDRLRCYKHLGHWWLTNWNSLRVFIDVISSHYPLTFPIARRIKHRIFGRKDLGFDWERWSGDDQNSR